MRNIVKIVIIFLIVIYLSSFPKGGSTMNIPEPWVFSTVYVSNLSTGKAGSGCLVSRKISEGSNKVFLVSNKHVLLPKELKGGEKEDKEARAKVFLNRLEGDDIKLNEIEILLRDKNGKEYWKSHPNNDIDVAAVDFTSYISKDRALMPELKIGFITEDRFATKEKLEKEFVSVGDRVIVLGYPLNLVEGGHCVPIARDGVIASHPTYDFKGARVILIDATMVRGSSGSPVFLPILPYKWDSKTNMNLFSLTQASFLGIVSALVPDWSMEIRKTVSFGQEPQIISVVDIANLGIVFKAETIKEVIDGFGVPAWEPPVETKEEKQEAQTPESQQPKQ